MSKHLVLVSHGRFCEELKASTEMIMGPEEFTAKFEACVADFDDYIVFADLLGGTPCNAVSRLILEGRAIDLYAGMNLPMVIEFINHSLVGGEENYPERARESVVKVNNLLSSFDDDEDE